MKNYMHPLLFTLFYLLFFAVQNPTTLTVFLSTVLILMLFSLLVLLFHRLILKNIAKASILTTWFLFLFFSEGQICILLQDVHFHISSLLIGPHKLVSFVSLLSYIGLYIFLKRTSKNMSKTTTVLTGILAILVLTNIGKMVISKQAFLSNRQKSEKIIAQPKTENLPNFYFIILDGFAGHDVLKKTYHYDNSSFLQSLEQRGFFVSWNSNSNYAQTLLSLSSNLNLRYIDMEKEHFYPNRRGLYQFLMGNDVFKYIKKKGYSIHSFATGYNFTEFKNEKFHSKLHYIDEFQQNLFTMTMLYTLQNSVFSDVLFKVHQARIEDAFGLLPKVSKDDNPIFVFAHLLCPHPPFIFSKDGQIKKCPYSYCISDCSALTRKLNYTTERYQKNYVDQIQYCQKELLSCVDNILKNDKNAIIVVQSDHGPGSTIEWDEYEQSNFDERMSILFSVYLPDNNYENFYQGISPVNTFRMLFNTCFDEQYSALPDSSYFSGWKTPFTFKNVTAIVQ